MFSALHRNVIRKIQVLGNMELSKSRKNDIFGKSLKFPGIPAGNFRDHRFPGILERELPVALAEAYLFTKWHLDLSKRLATICRNATLLRVGLPLGTIFIPSLVVKTFTVRVH